MSGLAFLKTWTRPKAINNCLFGWFDLVVQMNSPLKHLFWKQSHHALLLLTFRCTVNTHGLITKYFWCTCYWFKSGLVNEDHQKSLLVQVIKTAWMLGFESRTVFFCRESIAKTICKTYSEETKAKVSHEKAEIKKTGMFQFSLCFYHH